MNRSPPKTSNLAPAGGLFGSQQRPDDNVGTSVYNAGNTLCKDTQFGQPTNQFDQPLGYSYLPPEPSFLCALQFYHPAIFNMTPSSQPSSVATQGYPCYGPSWQAYDFPQRSYGGLQMFPTQLFTGHGPSSPDTPRVPPSPPGNNPVIPQTSSASTAPGLHPGPPGRHPIGLPTNWFQPVADPHRTDVAGIADLSQLPEIFYDQYDADYESDNLSDLGGAQGIAPISLKQTEFSLKQFAKMMG